MGLNLTDGQAFTAANEILGLNPYVPSSTSGITIAFGYDVGQQYKNPATVTTELWKSGMSISQVSAYVSYAQQANHVNATNYLTANTLPSIYYLGM